MERESWKNGLDIVCRWHFLINRWIFTLFAAVVSLFFSATELAIWCQPKTWANRDSNNNSTYKKKHPKQHTMFIKLRRESTKINSFHCCCCCCYCFCCFFVCFLCPNVQLAHQHTKFNGCAKFSFVLQAFASVKKIDRMRRCGGKKKVKIWVT